MSKTRRTIQEPIKVLASFDRAKIGLLLFSWRGRIYKISKINFFHIEQDGGVKVYHFAVTATGNNCYQISFNPVTLRWQLEDIVSA